MLHIQNATVQRSGFAIVREANVMVPAGEVTVLLGPNGAGKTTLMEAISGVLPLAGGQIALDGQAIQRLPRMRRAQLGLAHVEQGRAVFGNLSVHENLLVAANVERAETAYELFPELQARRNVAAGMLSGGEQQMLVIARALIARPRALLLDELSLGLAPLIVRRLMPLVRRLADEGMAVLLVEQFAALALEIGDRAYVLRHGAIVYSGSCGELRDTPELLHKAYLGENSGGENSGVRIQNSEV
jgi:branched-chain amino acid transport system ATP-binding protein